jgi:hypothetical protein
MSSTIYAEALVHPTMVSHPEPSRVLLLSDFLFAILNELHKYDPSVAELIDVSYSSPEVREKFGNYYRPIIMCKQKYLLCFTTS